MSSQSPNVLVVDDEPSLRKTLRTSLAASGFAVAEARNGEEALGVVQQQPFDLVLLDINMPGAGGIDTCRKIRNFAPQVGIIMITVRDSENDKVHALEAGADDYVTKPFRIRELIARLRAVQRRTQRSDAADPEVLKAGNLEVDIKRRLMWRGGTTVHLSPKEFDLLVYMMQNRDVPLTHARLLRALWGPEYGNELEYLRSYVKALRKKIEDDPAKPEYILTEPWVGYRFRNPSDPDSPLPSLDDD
jgi:two-component system, OmpR family, KDP operon response regulator KdpE